MFKKINFSKLKAAQGICKFTTSLAVRLWALQPMVQLKTLALL